MTALKLFVSHSSRLDDQEHDYADDQANWRLLREVCDALEARCQDSIQLLVDWSGLTAGDDWNRELNLWLAECHAAVVLVSKRALKRSDWVAKEASILGWRRALDPSFLLIPVLIAGESTKRDLATGFFGSLDMDRIQCVDVPRSAQAIVEGIAKRLGAPADLAARRAQTPLELLQGGIAHLLAQTATEASLETAAVALGCTAVDPRVSNRERFAEALAKQLFQTSLDAPDACFRPVATPSITWPLGWPGNGRKNWCNRCVRFGCIPAPPPICQRPWSRPHKSIGPGKNAAPWPCAVSY